MCSLLYSDCDLSSSLEVLWFRCLIDSALKLVEDFMWPTKEGDSYRQPDNKTMAWAVKVFFISKEALILSIRYIHGFNNCIFRSFRGDWKTRSQHRARFVVSAVAFRKFQTSTTRRFDYPEIWINFSSTFIFIFTFSCPSHPATLMFLFFCAPSGLYLPFLAHTCFVSAAKQLKSFFFLVTSIHPPAYGFGRTEGQIGIHMRIPVANKSYHTRQAYSNTP